MSNNIFTVRNVFCPHKDYNSFLAGKLTIFKLCNYGIVLAKVSRVIFFGLFRLILLFMKLILLLVNFSRIIRVASVYFVVCCLFSYL
jgi:hypothetical protein